MVLKKVSIVAESTIHRQRDNMMREIPLAFEGNSHPMLVDNWLDKLAIIKSFIATEGRTPKAKSSNAG